MIPAQVPRSSNASEELRLADTIPVNLYGPPSIEDFIEQLLVMTKQVDLENTISINIKRLDRNFFLKIAEMADKSIDSERKAKLSTLSIKAVEVADTVLNAAQKSMEKSKRILNDILQSLGTGPNGEFVFPLPQDALDRMRLTVLQKRDEMDEGVVLTLMAWMQKANKDGLADYIEVLQRVLQAIVALSLAGAESDGRDILLPAESCFLNRVIRSDERLWDHTLKSGLVGDSAVCSMSAFFEAIARKFETTVMQQPNGSAIQQAQAEYLRELETRARKLEESASAQ